MRDAQSLLDQCITASSADVKADAVLVSKLKSLPNVMIHTNAQTTEITGVGPAGTNCLVIVAGMNGPVPNTEFGAYDTDSIGIWFSGGLRADIPVILVSDGKVVLWHYNNPDGSCAAPELSIFAESVGLMGPRPPHMASLRHPAQGPLNNHFLPMLQGNGALPNVTSTSGYRLALVPGTWRASTP